MAYTGYHFFIGELELPYAPSKLKITIGSNNQTVDLISGNPINILKNPKLTEIEFDIELPRGRQYAFANTITSSKTYTDYFEKLMLEKTPTKLVITRPNPFLKGSSGVGGTADDFESTDLTVSLEGYTIEEDAENAYDVTVSLKFKEYISYGTIKQTVVINENKNDNGGNNTSNNNSNNNSNGNSNSNSNNNTNNNASVEVETKPVTSNKTYTIVKGDTLGKISKKFYGDSSKWELIYNANEKVIEDAAKKSGRSSSSKGHWIYPGTKLVIPMNT